jgi:hypothetical protein
MLFLGSWRGLPELAMCNITEIVYHNKIPADVLFGGKRCVDGIHR